MRRLLVAAILLLAARAHAFKWGERYQHAAHASAVSGKGQSAVECKTCHQLAPGTYQPLAPGRDDHHPCVDCHGGAEFARGPRCLTCHSSIRTMKPGRPWFPPFRKPGDFHVDFSHSKHVAMVKGDDCGGCHRRESGIRGGGDADKSPHGACARCHANGTLPDMNFCGGCHKAGAAAPAATDEKEPPSAFRVTFGHLGHASATAKKGVRAACTSCHAASARSDPPGAPAMKECESCHDGKAAFDARGTHCGKCHQHDVGVLATGAPSTAMFSHDAHAKRGVDLRKCTQCHGVGSDWKSSLAGRNEHRPCQNDGCHAVEFGKMASRLCLSCHERNDPFEPNPLRRPSLNPVREWRTESPHVPHLGAGVACLTCHGKIVGDAKIGEPSGARRGASEAAVPPRMPDDNAHQLCGTCHKPGSKLTLEMCASCHQSPTPASKFPWSTAARFAHDQKHREACENCHRKDGVQDLVRPTMAGCGRCHDGAQAFKVTGFGCVRCHGPRKKDGA